jgi:hypothetical protein
MLENSGVLTGIFGPKREETTEGWRDKCIWRSFTIFTPY